MTTTLYRAVSGQELALIEASGWSAFPPHFPGQEVFHPVADEAYARKVASECKVVRNQDGLGFVARFAVQDDALTAYARQNGDCNEYRIPADGLGALNDAIEGRIEIIGAYGVQGERSDILAIIKQ
jgi:hypothetical protein